MNDRQILAAAQRWHSVHTRRLAIGAEQRRHKLSEKRVTGISSSSCEIGQRLTAIKRVERAALRDLASICAKVRTSQQDVEDAAIMDFPFLQLGN